VAERVERYGPALVNGGPGVDRQADGPLVRYSDYEKLGDELDKAEAAADEFECQRDQARQEVLEEVAAEFERRAKEQVKNEAEWVESKMAALTYEAAAAHCRGLRNHPSGEQGEEKPDQTKTFSVGPMTGREINRALRSMRTTRPAPEFAEPEDVEAHETAKAKLEAALSKPCAEADWHEVWVWRDSITGKLQTTTGSLELSSIPPVSGIQEGSRRYAPIPATDTSKEEQ
jgi:hypothetical protein